MKKELEKNGITVIDERANSCKCMYNNNKVIIELNSGLGYCYRLSVNGKTVVTRGSLTLCISRILSYRGDE